MYDAEWVLLEDKFQFKEILPLYVYLHQTLLQLQWCQSQKSVEA